MINLRVLVPESTINYIKNPNFGKNTTGWTTSGATLTRSLDRARFGIASGRVVTAGSAVNEGIYYRVSGLNGVSEPITVSVYVRGTGKLRVRLRDGGGTSYSSDAVAVNDRQWTRLSVSGFSTGTNDLRLYVETSDASPQIETFYVDGAQLERKAYATTYCDGDQPGCVWNITRGASTSRRDGDTRLGGKWVDLAGPCRQNSNIYVTALTGFGMAPITNNIQSWGNAPGAWYDNTKINSRVMTVNFYVKEEAQQRQPEPDLTPLHALRQQLVDLFKPDRTVGGEAFLFEYSDTEGDRPLYIRLRYDGGLDGSWDVRNAWTNSMPVRFLAVDPDWQEDSQDVLQLNWKTNYPSVSDGTIWVRDQNDKWSSLRSYITGDVLAIVEGPDGTLYASVNSGGNSNIISFDGETVTLLGYVNNNGGTCLAIHPLGILYVAGNFSLVNGAVSSVSIAQYNLNTGVWSAVGVGMGGPVSTLCVADNGQLYIGGTFTTLWGGGTPYYRIARWDGTQYRTVGALSGFNLSVNWITKTTDPNILYVCGGFTGAVGGTPVYEHVAQIDTTTNLISALGDGLTDSAINRGHSIIVRNDGIAYCSTVQSGNVLGKIWEYRGGSWFEILSLSDNYALTMDIGEFGELYIGGNFTASPQYGALYKMAKYTNGAWTNLEGNLFGSGYVRRLLFSKIRGVLYVATDLDAAFAPYTSAYNMVTNSGSYGVFPILYVLGQATVRYIENLATKQAIYLNLSIFEGEEVEIDFARGTIQSYSRGSLLSSLQPGSELRAVYLLPGGNEFAILMDNEVTPSIQLRWRPSHWSADAIAEVEE